MKSIKIFRGKYHTGGMPERGISLFLCVVLAASSLVALPARAFADPGVSPLGLPDHLIINQAAGVGKSADGAVQYSFVEIYNPTNEPVALDGWSLQYAENGDDWQKINLGGWIPARHSYLVRMNGGNDLPATRLYIPEADLDWDIVISNDSFKFALVEHTDLLSTYNPTSSDGVVDFVSAINEVSVDFWWGTGPVGKFSKQQSVRRVDFIDTQNNQIDFISIDYRASGINDSRLAEVRPRSLSDGAWGLEVDDGGEGGGGEPEPAVLPDHLIINQVAGGGNNADGAFSHSFVEIYNPTDAAVLLDGYSLQYTDSGSKWVKLDLVGSIPAGNSFLVRANGSVTSANARYTIYYFDQNWNIIISNDSFKIALVHGTDLLTVYNPGIDEGVVDLIGAYNTSASVDYGEGGNPLRDISKQKTARRVAFQDTDNNGVDFISVDYRVTGITDAQLLELRPRSLRDGYWEAGDTKPLPEPPVSGEIVFSSPAGLYVEEFDLTLQSSVEGAVICYTLDGEDPSFDSPKYIAPIEIRDRTSDSEVLTNRLGTTGPLMFNGTYARPAEGTVFQGTVVKAQLFTEDGEAISRVFINSYFVSEDIFSRYGNVPIISISMPAEYFFNDDYGIYQRGPFDRFDDYIYPDYRDSRSYGDPVIYNFDQKWERPVYFEMFDPAADYYRVISQGMGARIHGSNSRHSAQKSLRLYTRTGDLALEGVGGYIGLAPVLNGSSSIDWDVFLGTATDINGNPITGGFSRLLFRSGGNDVNSAFIRDTYANLVAVDMNIDTVAYRPAVVFLNGEFWGYYDLRERTDDEYLAQHYGGNKDNYDLLENPSTLHIGPEQGTPESIAYFNWVVSEIEAVIEEYGYGSPEVTAKVLEYVDEASLIDYNIIETFLGNADWVNKINEGKGRYGNNSVMWRYTGTPTNRPGQDGRYRYLMNDMDHSFDLSFAYGSDFSGLSYAPGADTIRFAIEGDDRVTAQASGVTGAAQYNNYFFFVLMQDPEFEARFVNRYMDLLNTDLSADRMNAILNDMVSGIEPVWDEHQYRWSYSAVNWSSQEIGRIRTSISQRTTAETGILGNSLVNYAYVNGSSASLSDMSDLTVIQGSHGSISLNGMNISGEVSWTGRYFTGYTQTVIARPDAGYKFDHFILSNSSGTTIE
ncbi:MAG: CotH kinase family protein, partial [Coriobacteriia bacterium]|nr:CotH kinase family protein [Coriobacteriia bacterium]